MEQEPFVRGRLALSAPGIRDSSLAEQSWDWRGCAEAQLKWRKVRGPKLRAGGLAPGDAQTGQELMWLGGEVCQKPPNTLTFCTSSLC